MGFDWPEIAGVLEKIVEEIREVQEAALPEQVAEELGDLLFALVNLARWKKVDAESAFRTTNLKFKTRFAHIEAGARGQGRNLWTSRWTRWKPTGRKQRGNRSVGEGGALNQSPRAGAQLLHGLLGFGQPDIEDLAVGLDGLDHIAPAQWFHHALIHSSAASSP